MTVRLPHRRGFARTLSDPLITLALAGLLSADLVWVGLTSAAPSTHLRSFEWMGFESGVRISRKRFFYLVVVAQDNARAVMPLDEATAPPPSSDYFAIPDQITSRTGLYAPTRYTIDLETPPAIDWLQAYDIDTARHLYALALADAGKRGRLPAIDQEWIDPLLKGHTCRIINRPIYTGYLHNTLTLTLAALLLISLVRTPRRIYVERRAARRTRCGQCPTCAYDLAGLADAPCPECGQLNNTPPMQPPTADRE